MDFIFKTRQKPVETHINALLIEAKGDWSKDSASWDAKVREVPITMREYALLKQAHKTDSPNIQRATKVKSLMMVGMNPIQIHMQLRHMGRGFGLSSIKHDHAALSKR